MRWLACGAMLACANGATTQADSGAPEDAATGDVLSLPLDASSDATDASIDAYDAGCDPDGALGGVGLPEGTTASATTSYETNTPDLAIDGDPSTYWNAGATTGSLTLTFPSPQTFSGVKLDVTALPACAETYAITGFQNDVPIAIGQSTQNVPQGSTVLQTIGVTIGTYDAIEIDVSSTQSWVAIGDVALVTEACP